MLLYNMPRMNPMKISKGVDPHSKDVKDPQPMFDAPKFDNYFSIQHQDTNLMGYNPYGNFAATNMQKWSHQQQFREMQNNNHLINLVNGKRRGEF